MDAIRDNPEIVIGVVTVLLGLFSLANSLLFALIQRRAAKRERAVRLYEEFYSPETYRRMVAPVFRLMLKWRALPDAERAGYREVVRLGWTGSVNEPERLLEVFISEENRNGDADELHFRKTLDSERFTEHEALTAFLYFWTKVDEMLRAEVLDNKLVKCLFAAPFAYYRAFLDELCAEVRPHVDHGAEPAWIGAAARLKETLV